MSVKSKFDFSILHERKQKLLNYYNLFIIFTFGLMSIHLFVIIVSFIVPYSLQLTFNLGNIEEFQTEPFIE